MLKNASSFLVVAVLALCFGIIPAAEASMPVQQTLSGCVVKGSFYSIDGRAYRIRIGDNLKLDAMEGQAVAMAGWLYPGDLFRLDKSAGPVVNGACPVDSLRLIQRVLTMDLRLAAKKSAEEGDFGQAFKLINSAFAMYSPAGCDIHSDRAYLYALRGDVKGAAMDLAAIRTRQCDATHGLNWLLLQDVATVLVAKGNKDVAKEALDLALAACDSRNCLSRPSILEDIKAVSQHMPVP